MHHVKSTRRQRKPNKKPGLCKNVGGNHEISRAGFSFFDTMDHYLITLIFIFAIGFVALAAIATRDRFTPPDFPDESDDPGWTTIDKLNREE